MSDIPLANTIGTGDTVSSNTRRFSLTAPVDTWITEVLYGLLVEQTDPLAWTQIGAVTQEQAAETFSKILDTFGVDMATTGVIVPYAGGILPTDWLPCDGRSLAIADYPNLYAVIGNVWGSVDGAHFNIPDLRGKTLVGQGTNPDTGTTYNLGSYGGEEKHQLTVSELASHSHTDTGHSHTEGTATPTIINGGLEAPAASATPSVGVTGSASASLTNTGGDSPHENRPPFGVVNYAIIT